VTTRQNAVAEFSVPQAKWVEIFEKSNYINHDYDTQLFSKSQAQTNLKFMLSPKVIFHICHL